MTYREIRPSEILAPFVKCFWVLEAFGESGLDQKDRILPDGCMELIIHYGDLYRLSNEQGEIVQPRSFVFGQIKSFIELSPTGVSGMIGVRFYPHGASPFLDIPIHELSDQSPDLIAIFGTAGRKLEDRILNSDNTENRIAILEEFLIKRLHASKLKSPDDLVRFSVQRILKSGGMVKMDQLSSDLNIGHRQFERRFISAVGMNPKLLARIIRFQNVFRLVEQGRINSLTALSYESGYYDQAHFIRDFKSFAGVNPKLYFSQDPGLATHFTAGADSSQE